MKTRFFASIVLFAVCGVAGAQDVPPLDDLRKPAAAADAAALDAPFVPEPVSESERLADPAGIAPGGAVWYMTAPDASRCAEAWAASPFGKFLAEPAMERTFRNNRFGLGQLFGDLPPSAILPGRLAAMEGVVDLAGSLAAHAEAMAMAGYIDGEGGFSFVFLFDVGLDRAPAFGVMAEWETAFLIGNAGARAGRAARARDFIRTWTLPPAGGETRGEASETAPAAVAAGFAANMAVVSNNPALAERCLALAASGGDSVAASRWGRRLAASMSTSSASNILGFLRMDALLAGLRDIPLARDAVAELANYLGRDGRNGEALYYGLQFAEDGIRETYLLPPGGDGASPAFFESLSRSLKPSSRWTSPALLPYQPSPLVLVSANLEPNALGGLFRDGGAGGNEDFELPREAENLFSGNLASILTGELTLALYPPASVPVGEADSAAPEASWIMALRCREDPASRLPAAAFRIEHNGCVIFSGDRENWRASPSWTSVAPGAFRRTEGNFLLVASRGELLRSTLDQLLSGQSFAANRDYADALARTERNQGLFFYCNTPEIIALAYPRLSQIMRRLYPRSSGLNSRPPLTLLRAYGKGVTGAVPPADGSSGEGFTRLAVQSPLPTLGALAAGVVLRFPAGLREEGRAAMARSRENLQALWLRLQLYASRFGHFPETLEELAGDMIGGGTAREEVDALLTAPAALAELSPAGAREGSYTYMAGVVPGDEPDIPVLCEARPWSRDFSGMYPEDASKGQSETGEFEAFRQYIRLDGGVVVLPERRFRETVARRVRERE